MCSSSTPERSVCRARPSASEQQYILAEPLRSEYASISARHHIRARYDARSHIAPVCACGTGGATATKAEAHDANETSDLIAASCSLRQRCGIEK